MTPPREPTVVTPATLRSWALPETSGGKGARGRVVVVGGSASTPGAVLLAGEAALRAGGGKLTIVTAADAAPMLAVTVPESRVVGVPTDQEGSLALDSVPALVDLVESADAVLLGSGLVDTGHAVAFLEQLVPRLDVPVVVDALASAFLTEHPDGLRHLDGRAVLTVNPTELSRTAGWDEERVTADPAGAAEDVARASGAVVLCGGEEKLVVAPDGASWVVQGGGSGLGVSGSGDAQCGIVGGLLARGAEPAQAAVWGAYLHARAGERLASAVGTVGYLAREIPAQLPRVLTELT